MGHMIIMLVGSVLNLFLQHPRTVSAHYEKWLHHFSKALGKCQNRWGGGGGGGDRERFGHNTARAYNTD
jgi:hypothetical protein